MNDTIAYIIRFLLYGHEEVAQQIVYAPQVNDDKALITILGNGIDGPLHYPDLSQPQVETLPNGHYLIHTDLIYNTFFFLSRAEEVLNNQRDEYGRFLATYSILGQQERLMTPLIDTYSHLLLHLLGYPLPAPRLAAIYLTHDVDCIAHYRHLRGALGGLLRGQWKQVKASWNNIHNDPAYTFPWLIEQDEQIPHASIIFFVKDTCGKGIDYPQYNLQGKDYQQWVQDTQHLNQSIQFGVHTSAIEDKPTYRFNPTIDYTMHRAHYLACSIDKMQHLVEAGVTDDYTMTFPDRAGFRLQTTRAVKWINPKTRQVTPLTLHPLTLMDCTLSNTQYMHFNEEKAYQYANAMIDKIRLFNGEISLLWHNSNINPQTYHKSLYPKILQLL